MTVLITWLAGNTGCSSSKSANAQLDAARRAGGAGPWLERRASLELAQPVTLRDVSVPPGVPSFVLRSAAGDQTTATAPLDEVLTFFASETDWPPGEAPGAGEPPPSAEDRDAALKLYAKGRDAAISGRHYQAVTSLTRALEHDPTAVPVMQVLARSYVALRGRDKAIDLWQKIAHLDPTHPEAVLELALAAADEGDSQTSVGILARARVEDVRFTHDPAAPALADFALMHGLQQLGYDRAAVDVGLELLSIASTSTERYQQRLNSMLQQLGDVQVRIGDALNRLDEPSRAITTYANAAGRPLADPGALYPRVVYTNARLGRMYSAQYELLSAVSTTQTTLPVRLLVLAEYIRSISDDTNMLVRAVREHAAGADNALALTRVEARLINPQRGAAIVDAALRRVDRATDHELWHALAQDQIQLLARVDARKAVDRTAQLMEASPDDAERFALVLAAALPDPVDGIAAARHAATDEPMHAVIRARLLMSMDAYGRAWHALEALDGVHANDAVVLRTRMEIAARLNEPQLLEEVIIAASNLDDPRMWMARAAAWRTIGDLARARDAAARAAANATGPLRSQAMIEHASVHLVMSAATDQTAEERRQHAQDAAVILERVLEEDPAALEAAEMLASLYGPNGTLQNADRYRGIASAVFNRGRGSATFLRLASRENLNRQRLLPALELALVAADHDPTDVASLDIAVQCFASLQRLEDGLRWIDRMLAARPGNPALLERRTQLLVADTRLPQAIAWLREQRTAHPENVAITRLLEQAARQHGDEQLAAELARERLTERPDGIRKHLELAAHHAGRGDVQRAVSEVDAVLAMAAMAERQQLINAVGVLDRCRNEWSERLDASAFALLNDALRRAATRAIEYDATMPLQIYGMVLRDMAERDELGPAFDTIIARAVAHAPGAGHVTPRESLIWRDLAQALVNADLREAASRVVHVRLQTDPLPDKIATTILTRVAIAIDASLHDGAGRTLALLGRLHDAGRAPAWNSTEEPSFAQSCYEASQMYSLIGSDAGMIELLRAAVDAGSADPMVYNNLGYYLLDEVATPADEREAEHLLVQARRAEPGDPNIADSLGHLRYLQGFMEDFISTDPNASDDELRLPGALTLFAEAVAAGEAPDGLPSPEVYEHQGDALWRAGRPDEAIEAWQRGYDLLDDPQRNQTILRNYELVQQRVWGITVFDPQQRLEAQTAADRQRLQEKLAAARSGGVPRIALTFAEQRARQVASDRPPAGESND